MSTISPRRKRASLALGTALALTAASLTLGISPASAISYATVTGHTTGSSEENDPTYWCADGWKIDSASPKPSTYVLPADANPKTDVIEPYDTVIVKAGSDVSTDGNTNTIFAAPPKAGQTVWADSRPDFKFGEGDKTISHIIICPGSPPGTIKAVKEWTVNGIQGDFTPGTPGDLLLNNEVKAWDTKHSYPAKTEVTVAEAPNGTAPTAEGWLCVIDDEATTYTVGTTTSTTPPKVDITSNTDVTVTITNTADCTPNTPPPPLTGTVEAEKKWTVTGLDPKVAEGYADGSPGTLTFNGETKPWTDNSTTYDVGTNVEVKEAGDGTPPTATGYTCTIDNSATTYTVGNDTSTTSAVVPVEANTRVKVTITNTANCVPVTVVVIPPVVTPPVAAPPVAAPPVVTPPVVDVVEDEADVAAEEDVVEEDEETAVAGSEDELAATGGSTSAALLGALLVLSGAALIASRRRFGMTD